MGVNTGQGHTVEGVVLAGGVNGHIAEHQQISHGRHSVKAVITDDIPRKAGRPCQPHSAGLFAGFPCPQQRRAVGHLDHVRCMAGGAGIQDGNRRIAVLHHVQHAGQEIPCVQGAGLAGFQINRHAPVIPGAADTLFQSGHVVAGAGDVMPASEVQPLHFWQQIAEFLCHCVQRHGQRIGVLLT